MGSTSTRRRIVLGLAAGTAVVGAAVVLGPSIASMRRSLRTSSSPGASFYEMAAGLLFGGYYDDIARDIERVLGGAAAPTILEVGPGPGHLGERLLARLPAALWTGLDIDPDMLRVATRRVADRGLGARATLVEGDVASLPFPDAAFDLVVSSFSAHHWPDPEAGFREIRRALRPGGTALIYDLPPAWGLLEGGSRGIAAADGPFDAPVPERMRGVGPWTIVSRLELRPGSG